MPYFSPDDKFFRELLTEYKRTKSFDKSRIRQDLTKEEAVSSDYRGREVYELIQNAEDQNSEYVSITLDSRNSTLVVANGGRDCESFSEGGFSSIMMSDMSPKFLSKRQYIGHKGLGFRSLLNWSDEICIESSGVRCSFSREIAREYWKEISEVLDSPELVRKHEEFARNFSHGCPVAMLSIPRVERAEPSDDSARIIIKYRKESHQSIIDQLDSLSGKVLLFLKNIKRIDLTIDSDRHAISIGEESRVSEHIFHATTKDRQHPEGQKWCIHRTGGDLGKDKKYEIAIAYDAATEESGRYVYSFFPTRVPLDKPFVLHATFDLNSSRNGINESDDNDLMQGYIADAVVAFSEYLASLDAGCLKGWTYYRLLSFPSDFLPITSRRLIDRRDGARVFPTVGHGYLELESTLRYSESLASFLASHEDDRLAGLSSHLAKGYAEEDIESKDYDDELGEIINGYSAQLNNDPVRAELIYAVADVERCSPMRLLVDESGKIIERNAYINVGEGIRYLPDELKVRYVREDLITKLIGLYKIPGDRKSSRRQLLHRLTRNKCVDVSELDITALRSRILTYTGKMDVKGFKQLMFALFVRTEYSRNDDDRINLLFVEEKFNVLSVDGKHLFPSELLLCDGRSTVPAKWRLLGNIDNWVQWFNEFKALLKIDDERIVVDADMVRDFFLAKIGVSESIPMSYRLMDGGADPYIAEYSAAHNSENAPVAFRNFYSHNRFKAVKPEYLDYLVAERGMSLSDVIRMILNDKAVCAQLYNRTLHYQHYSLRSEIVAVSYPLYLLRQHKVFSCLRHYVVSEHMYLLHDDGIESQLNTLSDDPNIAHFLVLLGARVRMSELSLSELYDVLLSLPERNLKKGIQKIYKIVREAINRKRDGEEFRKHAETFASDGRVYARCHDQLGIYDVKDTYYWDNDQLPRRILDSKPKLEIGNRVGEESVKAIFGVRLAKEIVLTITYKTPNSVLTEELQRHIGERVRYLLAYRLHNSRDINNDKEKSNIAGLLRTIRVNVHTECRYANDGMELSLAPGDMISTDKEFHVLSCMSSVEDAMKQPSFCENITEAICIMLKVTGSEMANCFRRILKDSLDENNYVARKEISKEEWADVDKALGLSDFEKRLWVEVSKNIRVDMDRLPMLNGREKSRYLRDILPDIVVPDSMGDVSDLSGRELHGLLGSLGLDDVSFLAPDCLLDYYAGLAKSLHSEYEKSFERHAYIDTVENGKHPYSFFDRCQDFKSSQWYMPAIERLSAKVVNEDEIHTILATEAKKRFCIELDKDVTRNDDFKVDLRQEYEEILWANNLDRSNIDRRILSLALFEGHAELFDREIKKYVTAVPDLVTPAREGDKTILEIVYAEASNKPVPKGNGNGNHGGGGGHTEGFTPESHKILSGRKAEEAVLKSLQDKPEKYTCVKGVSGNLDAVNGNDNLHYDIEYKLVGSVDKRYLEVKSMSGDKIIMTAPEYDFARNNEFYDLAIVHGGRIIMLQAPFVNTDGHAALKASPDSYALYLNVRQKKDE